MGLALMKNILHKFFSLFERLHTKDSYEGTGIGLAITKKIMDKHNGMVTARSNAEQGAEFMLLFPLTQTINE